MMALAEEQLCRSPCKCIRGGIRGAEHDVTDAHFERRNERRASITSVAGSILGAHWIPCEVAFGGAENDRDRMEPAAPIPG